MMRKKVIVTLISILFIGVLCNAQNRWKIGDAGPIIWEPQRQTAHSDHIEMSGEFISAILRYGVNPDGSFRLERSLVWPMLRMVPNNTHGSLNRRFAIDIPSLLVVNNAPLKSGHVKSVRLDGCLTVESEYAFNDTTQTTGQRRYPVAMVTRKIFPSADKPVFCEQYQVKNITDQPVSVMIPEHRNVYRTDPADGVSGSYTIVIAIHSPGTRVLGPGKEIAFGVSIQAFPETKGERELSPAIQKELALREKFVAEIWNNLILETPDTVINKAFAFAKIRASESIYRTAGGLMHSPGGEAYYAAIWANDESEYVAPFLPFLGYPKGNEATLNTYRLYMKYMNPDYKPVPSSIIAEGLDTWQGAGDCGDAAMLAYGGLRYALARGDLNEARYLWPLMEWCLAYCDRKRNKEGVVESDSDELEGRFPSGKANILVSSLYYDALISAGYLGKELKIASGRLSMYRKQAVNLRKAIEVYFGANVEGFDTYAYYKGNTVLRSWICAPVFAGIDERAKTTVDALFSRLWTENGLLSQSGSASFWDRSTLCALRAVFVAGETEKAYSYLREYSVRRLLGDHVPYPIEAWPEGNQRHLSGESALYGRVITEGLFGIRPTGLRSFVMTPRLPGSWNTMALRRVRGFGNNMDIEISRAGQELEIRVSTEGTPARQYKIKDGSTLSVTL